MLSLVIPSEYVNIVVDVNVLTVAPKKFTFVAGDVIPF